MIRPVRFVALTLAVGLALWLPLRDRVLAQSTPQADGAPLAQRIQPTDRTKYRQLTAVHGGAGTMAFAGAAAARGGDAATSTSCTAA